MSGGHAPTVGEVLAAAVRHHQAGELDAAADLYRRILAVVPDQPDSLRLLAVIALQQGQPAEARVLLQRALAARPRFYEALSNLGNAYRDLRQPAEAEAAYRQALAIRPDYADAWFNLGNLRRDSGRLQAAIEAYRQALAARPAWAEAENNLGSALYDQGDFDQALAAFERALAANAGFARAWNNLGNARKALDQPDAARAAYLQALTLEPELVPALVNLGALCDRLDRMEEAIGYYRRALALDPGHLPALTNLGAALTALDRLDAAADVYLQAIAAAGGDEAVAAVEQSRACGADNGHGPVPAVILQAKPPVPVIEIPVRSAGMPFRDARKAVQKYGLANLRGEVINRDTGLGIKITREVIEKSAWSAQTIVDLDALLGMPELLATAIMVETAHDRLNATHVERWLRFYAPFTYDSRWYRARITVKESEHGRKAYEIISAEMENPGAIRRESTHPKDAAFTFRPPGFTLNMADLLAGVKTDGGRALIPTAALDSALVSEHAAALVPAYAGLARVRIEQRRWAEAEAALRPALALAPEDGRLIADLARVRFEHGGLAGETDALTLTRRLAAIEGRPPLRSRVARVVPARDACAVRGWEYRVAFPTRTLTLPIASARWRQAEYRVPESWLARVENAVVLPGNFTVLLDDRALILDGLHPYSRASLGMVEGFRLVANDDRVLIEAGEPARDLDEDLILFGGDRNFSHGVLDWASKLTVLERFPEVAASGARLLVAANLLPVIGEFLTLLGWPPERRVTVAPGEVVRCRRLWLPSLTHAYQYLSPDHAHALRARIAGVLDSLGMAPAAKPWRRLFLTRRRAATRALVNEAGILAALAPFGVEALIAEELPLPEQLRRFAEAELIVTPLGGGSAAQLFAPAGAAAVELTHRHVLLPQYAIVAALLGQRYRQLVGPTVWNRHPGNFDWDFRVDPAEVVQAVRELLSQIK